jgi:hypothetical protein
MARRSTRSGDKPHATHRLRDIAIDEPPPTCASITPLFKVDSAIVASVVNDGRLGNYADPAAAKSALPMHASRWATILSASATDTVHALIRLCVTPFQRLFASSSDFDHVSREFVADRNQSDLQERESLKSFSGNRRARIGCEG